MTLINIESLKQPIPPDRFSLFELGFRPFFLLAGLAALLLLAWWLPVTAAVVDFDGYYGALLWHGHEMVFGFAVAVIAGFLLTAVRNWTNVQTLKGPALAGLASLWLAGRLAALLPALLPPWLIALIDLAFVPLLALSLALPIIRADKKPQLIFVALLSLLFAANLLIHLTLLGVIAASAETGMTLAINAVLLIIAVMAGRVVPFFIEKGAPGAQPRKWPWLEKAAVSALLLLLLAELFQLGSGVSASIAAFAALAHALRLWGWYARLVWRVPLLWVLILGYAWLVLGLAMKAAAMFGWVAAPLALHAFAAAIGVLSLGMMARVALGHTGRLLQPAKAMGWAFALINLAMLLRVFGPLLLPAAATVSIAAAGVLWMLAFAIFIWLYLPILLRARVDGRPG